MDSSDPQQQKLKAVMVHQWRAQQQSTRVTLLFVMLAGVFALAYLLCMSQMEAVVSMLEQQYLSMIDPVMARSHVWLIPGLAVLGGLIASISPCVVALAPLVLGYIATQETRHFAATIRSSFSFTLGVVLVLSLYGLFTPFASFVAIDYRGLMLLLVGLVSVGIGLAFSGIWGLSVPLGVYRVTHRRHAFWVGLFFALIGTPCASPVLFKLWHAADISGGWPLHTLTMVAYATGYTAILFFVSLFAGTLQQLKLLREYTPLLTQLASVTLIVFGLYYAYLGIEWWLK